LPLPKLQETVSRSIRRQTIMNRPMLAATYSEDVPLQFPLLATAKIDGIRGIMLNNKLVSRSLKNIHNIRIRSQLESLLPDGADGEIQCGNFSHTMSVVMSLRDTDETVTYFWFDWAYDMNAPYRKGYAQSGGITRCQSVI